MPKQSKLKQAYNHRRQLEYLKIGVVMLPTRQEEWKAIQYHNYQVKGK